MEIALTTNNFQNEVIDSDLPALVDFWAPWCGPCHKIAPHLEQLAKDYTGKIKVCKLNVEEAPDIATKYSIMSIPALMLFKNGQIMETKIGAMDKGELEKLVQPYI